MKRRVVGLRGWSEEDTRDAGDWWAEAIASAAPGCSLGAPAPRMQVCGLEGDATAVTLDGEAAGVAVVASGRNLICLLSLRADVRGWGYGSEAVVLLTGGAGPPWQALAAPSVGLSLYFWLRLGFAPADSQPFRPAALLMERLNSTQEQE
ncbi:MAG: hypothetical protein WEB00_00455 [Dehalococcoidia bacterium]